MSPFLLVTLDHEWIWKKMLDIRGRVDLLFNCSSFFNIDDIVHVHVGIHTIFIKYIFLSFRNYDSDTWTRKYSKIKKLELTIWINLRLFLFFASGSLIVVLIGRNDLSALIFALCDSRTFIEFILCLIDRRFMGYESYVIGLVLIWIKHCKFFGRRYA